MAYNNAINAGVTGLVSTSSTGVSSGRTITGTTGQVIVTNGNGVSGNPIISLDPSVISNRSQTAVTRPLNTAFQVSATRWSTVRYAIDISTTVSLTGSQVGTVILEIASDAGFTANVQTILTFSNGNSGSLVVGLVLTQLSTALPSADVPPAYYVRIRTVNVTGVPTFTYKSGQEVLL